MDELNKVNKTYCFFTYSTIFSFVFIIIFPKNSVTVPKFFTSFIPFIRFIEVIKTSCCANQ